MQRSTFFFALLAFIFGFILFKVKYEVVELEQNLRNTLAKIHQEDETMHILKAEWSHLNEPQRLQTLSEKYLDAHPVHRKQVATLSSPQGGFIQNASHKDVP